MTTPDEPRPTAPARAERGERGVLCAKCEHLNPAEQKECRYCGARLFVTCKFCGTQNERVTTRCRVCGHRLHRSWWSKWSKRLDFKRARMSRYQIVLLIVSVYVTYRIVIFMVEYKAK